ncbi:hypothetical protein [Cellulosilyticum ruminicola]|uniref:hypothetical protein n=1 Tax=Cellulosilyticum ruminicola TaxID=425254 RepID=UPI0006CF2D54|nr:hypothetical protein [Cellulosilyticum ruminicola]
MVSDNINLASITGRVVIEGSSLPVVIPNAFVGLISGDVLVESQFTDANGDYTFVNIDGTQTYVVKVTKIEQVTTS